MDKSTLSNYGWVVIVTLVLAVMLALATPFGDYVAKGASNVIKTFANTSNEAIDEDSIKVQSENWDDYLNASSDPNDNIVTETSENVLMEFGDLTTETVYDEVFGMWASSATRVEFEKKYPESLTVTSTISDVSVDNNYALDVSAAKNGGVVAYLTTEDADTVLHIAGKNGVIMANANSSYLLAGLPNVKEINFNGCLNTSQCDCMAYFFNGSSGVETLNLSNFDTSNATIMYGMFWGCKSLKNINLSKFNTAKVFSFGFMFDGCENLETVDLSSFDTSSATFMYHMFANCTKLKTIDVSNFNTSNVTSMTEMFMACKTIKVIDISSFDTSKVTNIDYMFASCDMLEHVYVGENWNDEINVSTNRLFFGCNISDVEKK